MNFLTPTCTSLTPTCTSLTPIGWVSHTWSIPLVGSSGLCRRTTCLCIVSSLNFILLSCKRSGYYCSVNRPKWSPVPPGNTPNKDFCEHFPLLGSSKVKGLARDTFPATHFPRKRRQFSKFYYKIYPVSNCRCTALLQSVSTMPVVVEKWVTDPLAVVRQLFGESRRLCDG